MTYGAAREKMSWNSRPGAECSVLRILLRDPAGDAFDMAGLNGKDKLFLTATCSAQVIAEVIWISAHYDEDEALEGLEALVENIRNVHQEKGRRLAGHVAAIKEVADRLDGKVPQAMVGMMSIGRSE